MNKIKFSDNYLSKIKDICQEIDLLKVAEIITIIEKKRKKGKTIFVCGNGGSAATASHLICDFSKTSRKNNNNKFKTINLFDNIPLLTAYGNDVSYEDIFSEPLKNLGEKEDLLLVISASGNSPNIIKALKTAEQLNIDTVAFLGFDGGLAKKWQKFFCWFHPANMALLKIFI